MDKIIYKNYIVDSIDFNYSEASFTLNNQFNYIKFILADDIKNANKQRIPIEEFENLVKTGYYAPIKMASGKIEDGHELSFPLGVITHLQAEANKIKCIGALWSRERPQDVELLEHKYNSGEPINISWEILYADSSFEPDGTEVLQGTSLKAAVIVGLPAYAGRTQVYAFASSDLIDVLTDTLNSILVSDEEKERLSEIINKLKSDGNLSDEEKVTTASILKKAVATIPHKEDKTLNELDELKAKLSEATTKLAETQTKITELTEENTTLKAELDPLRAMKASLDKEKEEREKLLAIKAKFSEAGIEKGEEYFTENIEKLLTLSIEALDFMIQELVAFKPPVTASASRQKVPNIQSSSGGTLTLVELADALRERNKKT